MPRNPVNPIAADDLLHWIWRELPPYAERYMEATFTDHDPKAAAALVYAAPNDWRGLIALCSYWIGLPNPAYRSIVDMVWNHDHLHFLGAARGGAPQVRRMMAAAEFPVPMSGMITVYRGTSGLEAEKAVKGLAWTTSRKVACWFAFRFPAERPLVLKATVPASEVIYFSDDRDESEVVLRSTPRAALDNEGPARWKELAGKLVKARQAARDEHLAAALNEGAPLIIRAESEMA
jgi:hypothetical protein